MTKISTTVRRVAGTALAATMVAGLTVSGAGGASAADISAARDARAEMAQDEALWLMDPRHTFGMKIVESAIQNRMVQRNMDGLNPLFTGQLYFFHYNSGTGAYVVESFNGGCLDIADGNATVDGAQNNAPMRQRTDHGWSSQRFDMPQFVG